VTRARRNLNIAAVVLPFLAFVAAIPLLWQEWIGSLDLILLVVMYFLSVVGITVGFHRLLTHRAFQTYKPVEYLFAIFGSMAVEGPVIGWVSDHRKHHAHADEEGDPHSPHIGPDGDEAGALRGLWHAHLGWLFDHVTAAGAEKYAPDLLDDRGMRFISRWFPIWVALGLALPFALGWALTGALVAGLEAFFWAGLIRVFLVHHVTFSINSICHFFGRRRFQTEDESTNVFWLAIPSLGESWHHNHHAFPRAAQQGMRWWEIDISAAIITLMEKLGLAWNVIRISPERQEQRLAGSGGAPRRLAVEAD
jgi:stearoyl-CoA desaturase (Delta-9 desaturase)